MKGQAEQGEHPRGGLSHTFCLTFVSVWDCDAKLAHKFGGAVSELFQEDFFHHDALEMNGREGERIRGDILAVSL